MSKYRKKPVVVEAEQFWPDKPLPFHDDGLYVCHGDNGFYVVTIHGDAIFLEPGDWVIKEPRGQYCAYPCKPDIFEAIYEQGANTMTTDSQDHTPMWTLKRVREYLDERTLQDAYTECILLANEIVTEYERQLATLRAELVEARTRLSGTEAAWEDIEAMMFGEDDNE